MVAFFVQLKAFLDALTPEGSPSLFYVGISALVGGLIYGWRKVSIRSWDWVTRNSPTVQQLPALVLSALLSAAPAVGKPLGALVVQTILGALAGALPAIAGHTILKAIPWIPYQGGDPKPPAPPPPPSA